MTKLRILGLAQNPETNGYFVLVPSVLLLDLKKADVLAQIFELTALVLKIGVE